MRVVDCIGTRHAPGLLVLALVICLAGSLTTAQLFVRARQATSTVRAGWLVLASVGCGSMVWSTHFVAMMAYRSQAGVVLDPLLTLGSLLVAIVAAAPGLALAQRPGLWRRAVGGGLVGASISAMHYTGMAAYRVDGVVIWSRAYVEASVALAGIVSAAAFAAFGGRTDGRGVAGTGLLLAAAVALLHFTGMAAMTVIPAPLHGEGMSKAAMTALALATVFAGALVIGCAAVSALIDAHTREDAFNRLRRLALTDPLTQLPNRASFHEAFGSALHTRGEAPLAVVMMDLCGFKRVNDRWGHAGGDQLLVAVAARLSDALRPGEAVFRLGGDEFAALLPVADRSEAGARALALAGALEGGFNFERFAARCEASVGVAVSPEDGGHEDGLLANADLAMYRAKQAR